MLLSQSGGANTNIVEYWDCRQVRCFLIWEEGLSFGLNQAPQTSMKNLFRVACVDHCEMVLMAFLTCEFPPRKFSIQDLPSTVLVCSSGHVVVICLHCLSTLHKFFCGNKFQDLVKGTRFDTALLVCAIQLAGMLDWAVNGRFS